MYSSPCENALPSHELQGLDLDMVVCPIQVLHDDYVGDFPAIQWREGSRGLGYASL